MGKSPNRDKRLDVTGEEWRKRIDRVPDFDTRVKVSCIVWWDYAFSNVGGLSIRRFDDLDGYVKKYRWDREPDAADVAEALVSIGYPRARALSRCGICTLPH